MLIAAGSAVQLHFLRSDFATVLTDQQLLATQVRDEIDNKLQDGSHFSIEGQSVGVTASIGIEFYDGGQMTRDELLRRADEALYRAKRAGRDSYRFAGAQSTRAAADCLRRDDTYADRQLGDGGPQS